MAKKKSTKKVVATNNDQVHEALKKVVEALRPLPQESQRRVMRAAAALLDLEYM